MGPSQLMMAILEAAQYIDEPTFRLKKVMLNLPGRFDEKPVALNAWFFEIEQYC